MLSERIKKIYHSDKFPLIVFIVIISFIHIFMKKEHDDIVFSTVCNDISLLQYLVERYQFWTSRLIIETLLVTFCNFLPMILWKIANIGMYILLAYSISELFIVNNKRKLNTVLCICLLSIPIDILKDAGWIATMNNYLWVAATGLYAMIPIKKVLKNEKINIWQMISYIIATLYATNQEQMAGVIFIVYTFFILGMIKNKNYKPVIIIIYAITIISLVFIITCPGNDNRKIEEETRWYQGFSDLSLITKLSQGLTSMMDYVIESGRILFFSLMIIIAYILWGSKEKMIYKLIGISPLVLTVGYKYVVRVLSESTRFQLLKESNFYIIFKNGIYIAILLLIGISLYTIFKKSEKEITIKLIPILIYFVGIVSRLVMAFSPTIYASGERTAFFWYISICILIVILVDKIFCDKEKTLIKE